MRMTYHRNHSLETPVKWRKLRPELLSALICLIVLHAVMVKTMAVQAPQLNGSYLALASAGCIIALMAALINENHIRKLQSAGFMVANLLAMLCFY